MQRLRSGEKILESPIETERRWEYESLLNTINIEHDNQLRDQIKEINFADPYSAKLLYQFKLKTKQEIDDSAFQAVRNHRKVLMDSNRATALVEKLRCVSKLVGVKKKIRDNLEAFQMRK